MFFEKKRIAEGKGKNPARLQREMARGKPTASLIYIIKGEEVECHENDKGKLIVTETGKLLKLI